jgi:hypothetical protein
MRLLHLKPDGRPALREFSGNNLPAYAILSHTWGADGDEVTFEDIETGRGKSKAGYRKIEFCASQADTDGLKYFWVDTCCIDKRNAVELSEAINSMFRWYKRAAFCYVYLQDISVANYAGYPHRSDTWEPAFKQSRWFTRGWTLQELIAPNLVNFFSSEGEYLGNKSSLQDLICKATGIAKKALIGSPLSDFSVHERMAWAARRNTKVEEDQIYSLLGIFDISMPLIYGEGKEKARRRLQKEIYEVSEGKLSKVSTHFGVA